MLKIAIPLSSFKGDQWIGGVNYFRNLLLATNRFSEGRYQITLLTARPELFSDVSGVFARAECWAGVLPIVSRAAKKLGPHDFDFFLLRKLKRERYDLISHVHIGRQQDIATLPWVPDFQHRMLSHLFSTQELKQREKNIAMSAYFGRLLVSSQSAKEDFQRCYSFADRVHVSVLKFYSLIEPIRESSTTRSEICARYRIPERYFYVPNQFWQHKNHRILIEAMSRCRNQAEIVCSGKTEDYRNPAYFRELLTYARKLGVEKRFHVLGVIPYEDVISLMRHAMAVINPSLFEGWSTTVEEAKALGKRILLSSIPVHLEQAPDHAWYFPPNDSAQLAELLDRVSGEWTEAAEFERMTHAASMQPNNRRAFIDEFYSIARACVMGGSGSV
ncbi:MAG: glycosyltransferase family 1 protein [Sinobacteraceae bacterium]|nr:glycosyltransferase family 1 protein [Nevskiaceae bacterium]